MPSTNARARRGRPLWRRSPPWVTSIVVHALVLFALGLATMAVLHEPEPMLMASIGLPSETAVAELAEVEISAAEIELESPVMQPLDAPLPEPHSASPVVLAAYNDPLNADETGEFAFAELPLGNAALLEAGSSDTGDRAGGNSGGTGEASLPSVAFFGAEARAKEIAFVVDNSNSMDEGRLETALLEVARSVQALAPEQSFYVVFYSDAAYGLFHPDTADGFVPATPENKRRLREWLGTVEMCLGGRLVDAFRIVEKLEPQVVYLLSDGVIESEYALSYVTEPRDRRFTVHSIGMTVPDVLAAQRLQSIARVHGGVFRSVGVAPLAREMDRRRPIKKNRDRGPVWGIRLR